MARTTGRSGFKLKSGNKMTGSSFKMMGSSSPAKRAEVYADGVLVEAGGGTGTEAVEHGIKLENINTKKRAYNIRNNQEVYDKAQENEDWDTMKNIEEGNYEGGKKTKTITYTDKEAEERELASKGYTTAGSRQFGGDVVTRRKGGVVPQDYKMQTTAGAYPEFASDEEYQEFLVKQQARTKEIE